MKTDGPKNYRAAVIGLGFVGAGDQASGDALGQRVEDLDGTHARALAEHPRVELAAGASRDEGRRRRFTQRLGVDNTYADWREMLASERLDIVSVATYSPYHAEIAIACAEAGVRAALCEKPIATKLSDADRMIAVCREKGTLLAINHNRRWRPLWRSARERVRSGAVGAIEHVSVRWPKGRLGNVGTHMFDAIGLLMDSRAVAVSGMLDPVVPPDCRGAEFHDPGGWGIVRYENGARSFVDAMRGADVPFRMRLVGTLGQVIFTGRDAALIETWDGKKETLTTPADHTNSVALAVDDIVRCLTEGGEPSSTGEMGRDALEVIIGFHVSDRSCGQWTSLPIEGDDRELEVRIG